MRVIRRFRKPETLEDFARMLRLLLDDTFGDISLVDWQGEHAIQIDWSYDVSDNMPAVIIRIDDHDDEIRSRVEEAEQDWERQPCFN